MILKRHASAARSIGRNIDGTTAVEFAIVGPIIIALMFWFFDIAFSLYVRNSFNHAVNTVARSVYVDPNRTDEQIVAQLNDQLSRFGEQITAESTTETVGALDYHVISAQMQYRFKLPPFSSSPLTLTAEARAPIISYQLEEEPAL
jgi:Flp pilus assembly protein TadG